MFFYFLFVRIIIIIILATLSVVLKNIHVDLATLLHPAGEGQEEVKGGQAGLLIGLLGAQNDLGEEGGNEVEVLVGQVGHDVGQASEALALGGRGGGEVGIEEEGVEVIVVGSQGDVKVAGLKQRRRGPVGLLLDGDVRVGPVGLDQAVEDQDGIRGHVRGHGAEKVQEGVELLHLGSLKRGSAISAGVEEGKPSHGGAKEPGKELGVSHLEVGPDELEDVAAAVGAERGEDVEKDRDEVLGELANGLQGGIGQGELLGGGLAVWVFVWVGVTLHWGGVGPDLQALLNQGEEASADGGRISGEALIARPRSLAMGGKAAWASVGGGTEAGEEGPELEVDEVVVLGLGVHLLLLALAGPGQDLGGERAEGGAEEGRLRVGDVAPEGGKEEGAAEAWCSLRMLKGRVRRRVTGPRALAAALRASAILSRGATVVSVMR